MSWHILPHSPHSSPRCFLPPYAHPRARHSFPTRRSSDLKKEIQASQDAYILEEMAVQLKTLAEDPLLENYQAVITNIDFEFSTEEKNTYEDLEEVIEIGRAHV